MANMMHTKVVEQVNRAIQLMDDFLRNKIDTEGYLASLKQLDVDEILEVYADDFKSGRLDDVILAPARTGFPGERIRGQCGV